MNVETGFSLQEAQSSSPMSSPTLTTRRFSQFKPRTSAGATTSTFRQRDVHKANGFNFLPSEAPQRQLWRDKLRHEVAKRAKRDRERRHERNRSEDPSSGASSEGDYDDENADELDDELYRRVMLEERRRMAHRSELAYEHQFGDSDDILMGDVEDLEHQFSSSSTQQQLNAKGTNGTSELDQEYVPGEEDPEQLYQAYMAALESQKREEEDEFEQEFEDIDPQMLEDVL